jgi:hypothetical protein
MEYDYKILFMLRTSPDAAGGMATEDQLGLVAFPYGGSSVSPRDDLHRILKLPAMVGTLTYFLREGFADGAALRLESRMA